jgi:tetratricopeptide (TPR) repeat protein
VALLREVGDRAGVADGLTALTQALFWGGRLADAQARMEECQAIHADLGLRESFDLLWLSIIHIHQGRYASARAYLQTGLALARETDQLMMVADALVQMGHVAVCEGAYAEARRLLLESIDLYPAVGTLDNLCVARCVLSCAALGLGEAEEARRQVALALRTAVERASHTALVYVLPAVALLVLDQGCTERAVGVYELARSLPVVANSRWFEDVAGRPIAEAAAALPAEVVAAARERGQARDVRATVQELAAEFGE